nr:nucleic acid-binding, OB-fold protein [Tanacetum cinerariifolium]
MHRKDTSTPQKQPTLTAATSSNLCSGMTWHVHSRKTHMIKIENHVIIAVSFCKVPKYGGLQLSATPATYYSLNLDIPDLEAIRDQYRAQLSLNLPLEISKERCHDLDQEKTDSRRVQGCQIHMLLMETARVNVRTTDRIQNPHTGTISRQLSRTDHLQLNSLSLLQMPTFSPEVTVQSRSKSTTYHTHGISQQILALQGKNHIFQFHYNLLCEKGRVDFLFDDILDKPLQITAGPKNPRESEGKSESSKKLAGPLMPATPTQQTTDAKLSLIAGAVESVTTDTPAPATPMPCEINLQKTEKQNQQVSRQRCLTYQRLQQNHHQLRHLLNYQVEATKKIVKESNVTVTGSLICQAAFFRDTIQLENAVSTISQEYLLEFTLEYGIPESLHPELPGSQDPIVEFPEGKVGVYTKFFEFANFHMDLFSLISAPNPAKVKTKTHPRAAHEVSLLTSTANRVIDIEDMTGAKYISAGVGCDQQLPLGHPDCVPGHGGPHSTTRRIQAREKHIKNLEALLEAEADMKETTEAKNVELMKELESLHVQIKPAFEEFKKYEDDRVNSRCVEMDVRLDVLSIDFNEELYPHMLMVIAGHRWVIGYERGAQAWVENRKAKVDLAAIEAYDPEADTKYVAALHALKNLKYPIIDQLETSKDAPIDAIMSSLFLESDYGEDAPQWTRELCPNSSQLKIPVYPEVRNPKDPWSFKEEILLEDAIVANISRAKKKKKCRVVCRTHGVGSAHHAKSDGVPVSVPTVAPQGLAILLVDAATQTNN